MNARQNVRMFIGVAALVLIGGFSTQAPAKLSDPGTDQKTLIDTNVFAPLPSVRIDADSTSKEPLIRVAPNCPECEEDFG